MKGKNKLTIILGSVALALMICCVGAFFFYKNGLEPVSHVESEIQFEIKEGEGSSSIIARLKSEFLIKNELVAKLYMKSAGLHEFKVGKFVLDQSWSTETILAALNDPNNAISDQVMVTIPEGLWAKDIAVKVSESTNVSAEELLNLWKDEAFIDEMIARYEFLNEEIKNEAYPVAFEGYLYPETYFFFRETTARDVTIRLLDEFNTQYLGYKDQLIEKGTNISDLIKMASIVQFESGHAEDMKIIAGVFENRINQNYRLQSSVTVCYALYEYDNWTDCEENYMVESPYNTYVIDGLPIGPVCNPGLDAILAVLNPTATEYMYFIADVYGDKTVYYATTYEEHLANIEKYLNY